MDLIVQAMIAKAIAEGRYLNIWQVENFRRQAKQILEEVAPLLDDDVSSWQNLFLIILGIFRKPLSFNEMEELRDRAVHLHELCNRASED
ncbi:MAG: hypothetical protein RIG63_16805 [Coleofasciculus chthonoplastes F3-SA18-01]|uniref:hypothetical protein n=1 Tax=Coleofasciculus chthonoplastes TaxID=64178 RepID=UPI0032FD601D